MSVDIFVIFWIFIGIFTWLWWTPFNEARRRCARARTEWIIPSALIGVLIATVFLLVTQLIWCYFTLYQLVLWFIAPDRRNHTHQSAFLTHAIFQWSAVTLLATGLGLKLLAKIFAGQPNLLKLLCIALLFQWRPESDIDIDVERQTLWSANTSDENIVVSGPTSVYGSFVMPSRDEGYDGCSSNTFWDSTSDALTDPAPPIRKSRPTTTRQTKIHPYWDFQIVPSLSSRYRPLGGSDGLVTHDDPVVRPTAPIATPEPSISNTSSKGSRNRFSDASDDINKIAEWRRSIVVDCTPINESQSVLSDADDEIDEPEEMR